ncbi:protein translocase subunit SecD [Hoyosella sp. YIM 151337]|uniref:protein translocase subunit SecD n=1 Tax=Hoyosella sp. YIM 151337 TaxID=2992742 RepID=UPI002235A462|nr:protein translocase subunit SecD [Hoyosella sp. YIM 151337]MCW4353251.1 protein translocase subunit SecD [Hoyosella sp. YIM 151337]
MATSNRRRFPLRVLSAFGVIFTLCYLLVFFTGDRGTTPRLGVDLQGGTRVVLTAVTPDGSRPSEDALRQAQQIISTRIDGLGVAGSEVVVDGDNLVITVPGQDGAQARTLGQTARMFVRPVITSQPAPDAPAPEDADTGLAPDDDDEPVAAALDPEELAAQVSAARDLRQSEDPEVQQQALAEHECAPNDVLAGNDLPDLPLVTCSSDGTSVYLLGPVFLEGEDIDSGSVTDGYNQQQARWEVSFRFQGEAGRSWATFTRENVGQQAAFVLDTAIVSAPVIREPTPAGSATSISGNFTQQEVRDLANQLRYGALPLSFESSQAQTVSATLGLASLEAGLIAGAIGMIAVLIYSLAYYRLLGIVAALSLGLAGLLVYGILVLLGRYMNFTLDLAAIAGFIIGIGMTADSFIVFFERIKDEMREGRSFRSAVERGWQRARRTILTGNAVSFLAAAILYILAVGQVKGFAFALGLTTIIDLVVVFMVTYPILALATKSKLLANPRFNGLGAITQVARERAALAKTPAAAKEAQV